jgi:hypothetical protein
VDQSGDMALGYRISSNSSLKTLATDSNQDANSGYVQKRSSRYPDVVPAR